MSLEEERASSDRSVKRKGPGSRALRKGRISLPGSCYCLTKKTLNRDSKPLQETGIPQVLIESILWAQEEGHWRLLAFVVMPEHYHVVVSLGQSKDLKQVMKSINHHAALAINRLRGTRGSFWQEGFHDRCIRPHEDIHEYVTYIHMNPVRAGLAEHPEDWPWSSAHADYREKVRWE